MPIIFLIGILVCAIAFASGLYSFRYLNKGFKFLVIFAGFAFFTELGMNIAIKFRHIENNMPELHIYIILEFLFLSLFFREELKGFVKKNIILAIIVLFEAYLLTDTLFIGELHVYPNISRALEGIILLTFSIILFYKILVEVKYDNIWKVPVVWINFAMLLYFAGIFFHIILFNEILNYSREVAKSLQHLYEVLDITFYLIISAGFFVARRYRSNLK